MKARYINQREHEKEIEKHKKRDERLRMEREKK